MKIRTGFVSNSSASSFVLKKRRLNKFQIEAVVDHDDCARKFLRWKDEDQYCNQRWRIKVTDKTIEGDTSMDNFSMEDFMGAIGIPMSEVKFEKWG